MWQKKRSRTLLNILLIILIIIVACAMYMGYSYISAKQKAQDEELVSLATQSRQDSQLAKEESYEQLDIAYQKDVDTVAQYMPGIVCWGDILTQGTASGISYPGTLRDLIDRYIVDRYSFKSTLDDPYQYTRVDWSSYKVSIPVVNMGTGSESTYTILGRSGIVPYVLTRELTIPASCETVQVYFSASYNDRSYTVKPLIKGDGGVNPVIINGVEGTLSADPDSYSTYSDGYYYFTRSEPGIEVVCEKGTEIVTAASNLYKDYIHVIYIGTYGQYDDAEDLQEQIGTLLSRQTSNTDRFIIVGVCSGPKTSSSFYEQFSAIMTQKYGSHFLDFRRYLITEGFTDLDITPTARDTSYIKYGNMPESFYLTGSTTEFKPAVYERLGQLIFDRMDSLGYFDEIRDELCIDSVSAINASLQTAQK